MHAGQQSRGPSHHRLHPIAGRQRQRYRQSRAARGICSGNASDHASGGLGATDTGRHKLIFEMHYTPIGTPQQDRSSLGLLYMDEKDVTHQMWTTNAINQGIEIPAHAANHREMARKTFEEDVTLLSMFPHMHIRGKSFRYELTYPDGEHEILLDVPDTISIGRTRSS